MPAADQGIITERYQIIPRVLIFVMRRDAVLLIKLLPKNGKRTEWTGRYNGPGGHVERGEDILIAARRELLEETGLNAELSLNGIIFVDTGQISGIGLFIFRGENETGELSASNEGIPEWISFENLREIPLVEDVAIFLDRICRMTTKDPAFVGRSYYDDGNLKVEIE
jgi:8-oxo-dGTP pyrophosphatase MutT (NUDIX family)